jgi:ArsR family transcriptional regulator, arsenate/arsenite/antimonite-responsive transcriptional repressor
MLEPAARGFAAMGSEARLQVLKVLVRAGEPGLPVGNIQQLTGIAPSTLAHHLKFLAAGGLITQHKVGRATISRASYAQLHALADFILAECCVETKAKVANDG